MDLRRNPGVYAKAFFVAKIDLLPKATYIESIGQVQIILIASKYNA